MGKIGKNSILVEGFEDVIKALDKIEPKLVGKALRPATRAGAKVILSEVKNLVPVDEGDLKASLKVRAPKRSRKKRVGTNVVAGDSPNLFVGDNFYAGFLEFGREGQPATPFMRPALDAKAAEATQAAADVIMAKFHELVK